MKTFLLSIVLLFCMMGTTEAVTYHFKIGGGYMYPPIYINPYFGNYHGYYGNYYGYYGYSHGNHYNRIGRYQCMMCGRFHKYGYSCANPGVYSPKGFNRGYYYNQRQNKYRQRQRKLEEYLGRR